MLKEQLDLEAVAQAVANAMPPLDVEDKRIALALYRLLAKGAPVSPATVAEATGLSETRVRKALTAFSSGQQPAEGPRSRPSPWRL